MKAEIERYNELCHKGVDEDFGKMAKRMFPVENPPYYACQVRQCRHARHGRRPECTHDLEVTKNGTNDPIPGLYVAGNDAWVAASSSTTPVVVAGISLGTALDVRPSGRQERCRQRVTRSHSRRRGRPPSLAKRSLPPLHGPSATSAGGDVLLRSRRPLLAPRPARNPRHASRIAFHSAAHFPHRGPLLTPRPACAHTPSRHIRHEGHWSRVQPISPVHSPVKHI